MRAGIPEEEKNRIRYSTRTGRPFGSENFIRSTERKLDRRFTLKSPGRPRKKNNNMGCVPILFTVRHKICSVAIPI